MRRLTAIILLIFFCTLLFAQSKVDENSSQENKNSTQKTNTPLPAGYGELTWGTYLSSGKEKIVGKITYTDEKSIIVSSDGELEYHYGFFYPDPEVTTEAIDNTIEDSGDNANITPKDEGRLFYVSIKFPYLDKEQVYNKIKTKYGNHTSENLTNNQGAIAWNSEKTIIIMWIDRYEKKPFCRRITYISKEISKELNQYSKKIFNKSEIELIKKLNP